MPQAYQHSEAHRDPDAPQERCEWCPESPDEPARTDSGPMKPNSGGRVGLQLRLVDCNN